MLFSPFPHVTYPRHSSLTFPAVPAADVAEDEQSVDDEQSGADHGGRQDQGPPESRAVC